MARLERSESLKRNIRKDNVSELGLPTVTLAKAALEAGDTGQALKLFEYGLFELRHVHDVIVQTTGEWLEYIVNNLGEAHVPKVWGAQIPNMTQIFLELSKVEPKEKIYRFAETFRGHSGGPTGLGEMTITEENDRFVIMHDPCGSGGKLRRRGIYGLTQKAYQWSWNKTGVPYYCTHCCLFWELTGIDICGYPLRIHENIDKPLEPCIQYIYKRPELIPEQYFTRLGKVRDTSRFK
jgi:hypothetical protein